MLKFDPMAKKKTQSNQRLTGSVVNFFIKRGFGFIKPADGGNKVFAHWSAITSSDKWPRLERDEEVEYTQGEDDNGREAALNITWAGGEEINYGDEEKKLSKGRCTGVVRFFNKKGFGFIETTKDINWPYKLPAGSQVYVGREELQMADDSTVSLWRDMEVEFNVYQPEDKEKGLAAASVTAPGGEPLVFERPERPEYEEEWKPKGKAAGKGGKAKGKSNGKSPGVRKAIVKSEPTKTWNSKSGGKSSGSKAGKGTKSGKGKGKGKR